MKLKIKLFFLMIFKPTKYKVMCFLAHRRKRIDRQISLVGTNTSGNRRKRAHLKVERKVITDISRLINEEC
ncbi:MAG: hypothetical protein KAR42_16190 [candidate division Zixibacteria bacterium]|nr:hypothetical protein [candidate division Zixibacteria bacterium]